MKRSAGFTIYELLITVAVIGILSAIAAPPLSRWIYDLKLNYTLKELQSDIQTAKMLAITNDSYTVINFYHNYYIIFLDNGDWKQDSDENTLIRSQVPDGLYITTNFRNNRLRFNSRGNLGCRLGSIELLTGNNKSKKISISSAGRINLKW